MTNEANSKNIVELIEDYLNTFMVFPDPEQATVCALWVLHTWTFSESFPRSPYSTPYLYVNSDGPGSGKTLLIDLLEPIVLNPERTINMSSSVMFRLIEHVRPTLLVDEIDTVYDGSRNSELQNVINGGYRPGGYVYRNSPGPDGPEPTKFRTFCAKLLAGIDNSKIPETILTRSINISLRRVATANDEGQLVAPDGSTREIHYTFVAEPMAEQLVAEIEAFMAEWKAHYNDYMPKPSHGMISRRWELAMPLVQVARQIGMEDRAREVLARATAPRPAQDSPEQAMLRAIRTAFDDKGTDRMFTADLVAALGEGWNGKLLSKRLDGFVSGAPIGMTIKNRRGRGYSRYQFDSAFSRYLD